MVSVVFRGVYIIGWGSSGVGLIVVVYRDFVINEMVFEGGVLVGFIFFSMVLKYSIIFIVFMNS